MSVTSSRRHSATVLSTTVDASLGAMVKVLSRHLTYDSRVACYGSKMLPEIHTMEK